MSAGGTKEIGHAETTAGKRSVIADGEIEIVAKNSNGDGSVHFEPPRTEKNGRVRKGFWRANCGDENGRRQRVEL